MIEHNTIPTYSKEKEVINIPLADITDDTTVKVSFNNGEDWRELQEYTIADIRDNPLLARPYRCIYIPIDLHRDQWVEEYVAQGEYEGVGLKIELNRPTLLSSIISRSTI